MGKAIKWIAIVLAIILFFVAAFFVYNKLSKDYGNNDIVAESVTKPSSSEGGEEEPEYQPAPDFSFVDGSGKTVKLSDFKGKPVVLNFWATWCGFCKMEMPVFEKVHKELGKDVNFIMLNMTDNSRETVEKAKAFISENGYTFPVYFDTELQGAYTYGANSLPVTFFIDKEGRLIARYMGAIEEETLRKGIDMAS